MDKQRRKELLEEYKQVKTYMGIYQLKNNRNGKILIGAAPNLKNRFLTLKQQLDMGLHRNAQLQADWKAAGENAFSYEVLEEKDSSEVADRDFTLKQMELFWLERLQPYGENGYHRPSE